MWNVRWHRCCGLCCWWRWPRRPAWADGADGTVCGAAFAAMLGLMMLETQLGWFPLAVFPAALAGALMAFLLWDFPPAKLHPAGAAACMQQEPLAAFRCALATQS